MGMTKLRFKELGPFEDVRFQFDPTVNLFVGANNTGKSTALSVIAEIVVYPFTLRRSILRSDKAKWWGSFSTVDGRSQHRGSIPLRTNSTVADLIQRLGFTMYVPALRHSSQYRSPGPGPRRTDPINPWVSDSTGRRFFDTTPSIQTHSPPEDTAHLTSDLAKRAKLFAANSTLVSDQDVVQKIIELDYMAYRLGRRPIKQAIERVATIVSEITEGFPLTFVGVNEDDEGLYPEFDGPDGQLPLDKLSQGTQSIIQWVSRLVLGNAEYYDFSSDSRSQPGIFIVDEIDAHLHPSWQRRIIPTIRKYYPNIQLFASTHSPLMLAGLQEGQIHLMTRGNDSSMDISRNQQDITGWTTDEILSSFMHVQNPTDMVTAHAVERMSDLRSKAELTKKETLELKRLKKQVSASFGSSESDDIVLSALDEVLTRSRQRRS